MKHKAKPSGPRINERRNLQGGKTSQQGWEWIGTCRRAAVKGWQIVAVLSVIVVACWALVVMSRELQPQITQWFAIQDVTIDGLYRVTRQEVLDRLGLKGNTTLFSLHPGWLAQRLKSHPWIKDATVTPVPLNEIRIVIRERVPAVIVRASGENLVTDEDGVVLAKLGRMDDPSLPILFGIHEKAVLQGKADAKQAVRIGVDVARLISQSLGGRPQVDVSNPYKLVASVSGVTFQLKADALGEQWDRFLRVKPRLLGVEWDGEGQGINEIDLRYADRVIVRGRG